MIEPLEESNMLYPLDVGKKLNEIIAILNGDVYFKNFHSNIEGVQVPTPEKNRPVGGGDIPPPNVPKERVHEDDGA